MFQLARVLAYQRCHIMLVCYDFFYFLLHFKKLIAHNISQSRSLVISLVFYRHVTKFDIQFVY